MGDNNKYFCYFVEGDNEKKIVNELKGKYLESGVVNKFNILQEKISNYVLRKFSNEKKNISIIVYDYDVFEKNINTEKLKNKLEENIKILSSISQIVIIEQNKNLEDELKRATNVKEIREILNSKSNKDWKRDMLNTINLLEKLEKKNFQISKFWINNSQILKLANNSYIIRINI
ncbi:hypothetical protein ACDQ58_04845 [Fusobacterium animalis]|uniref:Uncharacterized protein n=1 Tax=Fusobacterium nucleatum TaxID=851 RepID=A0A133PBA2_FUSNU|nr:hypothetical protein [Fusobacterium nucleatum]KXA25864.1 hypothetical protein HMPREF3221_00199 [Fusobacterium nucleatum]MCL4575661.1 hypothetical protein [Fusobacterium nucleatum YWH7056]MCL4583350.1 hypothetical protein [Fusobacterium nucleatum YWH7054]MCL4591835.1 hypothetical protein [Fusobacterium nucleatum YWH7053]